MNKSLKVFIGVSLLVVLSLVYYLFFIKPSGSEDFILTSVGEKARSEFNAGNLDSAIQMAEAALSKNPDDISALQFLAAAYAQKGSVEFKEQEFGAKAEELAQRILKLDPTNTEALRTVGYSYEIRGDLKKAVGFYSQAIASDISNTDVLSNRAHAYVLLGDYDSAREDYEAVLRLAPDTAHALIGLAKIKISENKNNEARDLLSKAVLSDTTQRLKASAEQLIGVSYLAELSLDNARTHFEKAITLDVKLESAWVGKAQALMYGLGNTKNGDEFRAGFTSVVDSLKQAIELNPNYTRAYLTFAELFEEVKDSKTADLFYIQAGSVLEKDNSLSNIEREALAELIASK